MLLEFLFHAKPENHPKNSPLYQIKSCTLFIECIWCRISHTWENIMFPHFRPNCSVFLQRKIWSLSGTWFWVSFFLLSPQTFALDLNLSWADKLFVDLHCMNNWHRIRGCIMIKSCLQWRFLVLKKITSNHPNLYPNVKQLFFLSQK